MGAFDRGFSGLSSTTWILGIRPLDRPIEPQIVSPGRKTFFAILALSRRFQGPGVFFWASGRDFEPRVGQGSAFQNPKLGSKFSVLGFRKKFFPSFGFSKFRFSKIEIFEIFDFSIFRKFWKILKIFDFGQKISKIRKFQNFRFWAENRKSEKVHPKKGPNRLKVHI